MSRPAGDREEWAEELLDRLTPAMSAFGILFLLVVLGEQVTRPGSAMSTVLTVAGWLLWAVFVVELAARLVVAPDTGRFLRRNWWQIVFLVLPFLRVLRLVRSLRVLRTSRVLSSALRGSRSAGRVLGSRLGWLGSVVAITILGASQLLYQFSAFPRYADALHAAALGAFTGEPLAKPDGFAQITEVVLGVFSVVVFGALAAMLGAFFTETRSADKQVAEAAVAGRRPQAGPVEGSLVRR